MRRLFPLFTLFLALSARAEINPEWTTPLPPSPIADNLYYVGSQELAAIGIRRAVHASLKLALAGKREQRAGCLG